MSGVDVLNFTLDMSQGPVLATPLEGFAGKIFFVDPAEFELPNVTATQGLATVLTSDYRGLAPGVLLRQQVSHAAWSYVTCRP